MLYVLLLNDMRAGNVENIQPVLWSDSPESLVRYMREHAVEAYTEPRPTPYGESTWYKVFRKGSLLEWCNPPSELGGIFGGIHPIPASVVNGVPMYDPRPVPELAGLMRVS